MSRRHLWSSLDKLTKQIEAHHATSKSHQHEARHIIQTTIVPQIQTILNDVNKNDLRSLLGNELLFSKIIKVPEMPTDGSKIANRQSSVLPFHFLTLLKTPHTELTAFALPPGGAVLPLHDHPDMSVMMKVLDGRLQRYAANWIEEQQENQETNHSPLDVFQRRKKIGGKIICSNRDIIDATTSSSSSSVELIQSFNNTGGVLHELWSEKHDDIGAIFLDFFTPRYYGPVDEENGVVRDCTYYRLVKETKENNNGREVLVGVNPRDQKVGDAVTCVPLGEQDLELDMNDLFAEMMALNKAAANQQKK